VNNGAALAILYGSGDRNTPSAFIVVIVFNIPKGRTYLDVKS